jgi:hypothetical protein
MGYSPSGSWLGSFEVELAGPRGHFWNGLNRTSYFLHVGDIPLVEAGPIHRPQE